MDLECFCRLRFITPNTPKKKKKKKEEHHICGWLQGTLPQQIQDRKTSVLQKTPLQQIRDRKTNTLQKIIGKFRDSKYRIRKRVLYRNSALARIG
jgi:hypothetical protein